MNLSPLPIQKFFGNNGRPLAGGLLFTYEAGTSTKIATYTDSSGVTPNTNPIVLDFRGECRLWIDPQQSYKFILSTPGDTDPPTRPIWTVDDITAAPQAFDNAAVDTGSVNNISLNIPQISSPVAFTRVVFQAANTNTGPTTLQINGGTALPLTWQNRAEFGGGEIQADGIYQAVFDGAEWQLQSPALLPTLIRTAAEISQGVTVSNYAYPPGDIRRYGASPSASAAVNADAIAAAISQAFAATGAPVLIADGNYSTNNSSVINYGGSGLQIIGRNATLTVGADTTAITISGSENVTVSGLVFNSASVSGLDQRGLYVTVCGRVMITECIFRSLTYGVYMDASKTGITTGSFPIPSTITNSIFQACGAGIYTAPSAEYIVISDNIINDCTIFGIGIDSGNIAVTENVISGNDVGVQIDGSLTGNGDHGAVIGNIINHNAKANLVMKFLDYAMLVTGNNFWAAITSNYGTAPYDSSYGVLMINATGVTFIANVLGNSKKNMGLNLCSNNVIQDNVFHADNVNTTFNIEDIDGSSVVSCAFGRNAFKGTLVAGANNNNTEQIYAPTLAGTWVNFGAGFRDSGYWRDAAGVIHLTGIVKSGVIGTPIFTLPAGFRPSAAILFAIVSNALFGYVQVTAAGVVSCEAGNNAFVCLDGISFKAE